jgi:dolichyl-phosphate beta-glucosyltransferase
LPEPLLTLIVPCYNEAQRLPQQELLAWAARRPDWSWILVDDGSRDSTLSILQNLSQRAANVRALALPANAGKAEAVRQGLRSALDRDGSAWVGYLDADMATSPAEIERMLAEYASSEVSLVMGCRLKRLGSNVRRSMIRHYGGRVVASGISMMLRLPTYDTQCGAKIFRRELAEQLLDKPFVSRWLFDVELLARCRNLLGRDAVLDRVVEFPLQAWEDRPGSKLRVRDVLRVPVELFKLHRIYNH